jgi:phosphopantothenoylcysteine decarboxylase/phosphopantothenate--cysteine ligase
MTHVLLGVGAGIAAYKVAALASSLAQAGHEVRVAMTPDATKFVGPVTFAGLTGKPVVLSTTQVDPDGKAPHLDAAQRAEVYVIAPATADLLARLAMGAAADPVALLALTCRCPVLVCPAMNDAMWTARAVQDNVARLAARGVHLLGPVTGHLAEGYDAIGRMVEPAVIERELLRLADRRGR